MSQLVLNPDVTRGPYPVDYGIPHPQWREYQLETVQWTHDHNGVMFCEQPTGSGKTAVVAAQATFHRTVSLTRTKALQDQYGEYRAKILYGRSNYKCIHPDNQGSYCDQCLYAESGMSTCPYSKTCLYMEAKHEAMNARLAAINYAYWLSSKAFRAVDMGLLALDECHLLPDIVCEWAGCTVHEVDRRKWLLPSFPLIKGTTYETWNQAIDWLEESHDILSNTWSHLQKEGAAGNDKAKTLARQCERVGYRVKAALEALTQVQDAWYIRSGPMITYYRGQKVPGIIVKPLTAKYHFPRLFLPNEKHSRDTFLMSATIGDFDAFAEELGVRDYVGRRVPDRYPPSVRPIHILDVPKLSYRSGVAAYAKQADEIARFIHEYPPDWSGIIHVTRKNEAKLLAERLARRGLEDRVYVPDVVVRGRYLGTQEQRRQWDIRRTRVPGSIMVAWQFWAGYDGREEKICITAKTPYPAIGEEYERLRMEYSHSFYNLRTAWEMMQSWGRTRRGRDEDYDLDGKVTGAVAQADGNWVRVKKYISEGYKEAFVYD